MLHFRSMRNVILLVFLSLFFEAGFAAQSNEIRPDPVRAKLCSTDEGRQKIWDDLPKFSKMDIELQAQGNGVPPEDTRRETIDELCSIAIQGMKETFDWKVAFLIGSKFECKSAWNNKCIFDEKFTAPEGYQVCSVVYGIASQRGENKFSFTPRDFVPDTPGHTRRFRSYQFYMYSKGKYAPFDKEGANIHLSHVAMYAVPQKWTDDARRKLGCVVPPEPPPPPPPTAPKPPPDQPVELVKSESKGDNGHSYRIGLANVGTVPNTSEIVVEYFDRYRWVEFSRFPVTVQPNTTYLSDGFPSQNAIDWRSFVYMMQ